MKKFIVAKFLDFKIVDNKAIVTQVQELQVIIHDLLAEGINLNNTGFEHIKFVLDIHITFDVRLVVNDAFQVAAIIEKLPPCGRTLKTT